MTGEGDLRRIAEARLRSGDRDEVIEAAARLLKIAAEIETSRAEAGKLDAERRRLKREISESAGTKRSDNRRATIAMLAPLLTAVTVVPAFVLQTYQFTRADAARVAQEERQTAAAEDARWVESIKILSESAKVSPVGLLIGFTTSKRYGDEARRTALQLLWKTEYAPLFESQFRSVFEPVGWRNFAEILSLDRALNLSIQPLADKSWDRKQKTNITARFTKEEEALWDNIHGEFAFLGERIATILRKPRPAGCVLDLHSTNLWHADLSGADLHGAILTNAAMSNVYVKGANLVGVTECEGLAMAGTAWWQAGAMSKELLEYLVKAYPFETDRTYTSKDLVTDESMKKDVDRLRQTRR